MGQPKGNIAFSPAIAIQEVINSFKNKDDLFVDGVNILEGLIFDSLVADIKPIGKVFPNFLFVELYFLPNVQIFSQLYQNSVYGVEIVAVVAACGGEVQDGQVPAVLGIIEMLPWV